MGRGRRSIVEQSQRKPKILSTLPTKNPQIYFNDVDPEKDVSFVFSGDAIQELKKMDPKDFAAFVLRKLETWISISDMLVAFHLVAMIVNEFLTPEWQKNVRDISREVVAAMREAKLTAF